MNVCVVLCRHFLMRSYEVLTSKKILNISCSILNSHSNLFELNIRGHIELHEAEGRRGGHTSFERMIQQKK